jgi:hypothetical protein
VPNLPQKDGTPAPTTAPSSHKPPAEPTAARARFAKRGFVQQFDEDRTCADASCTTKLSRYNSQTTCSVHDPDVRRLS